MAVKKKKKKEFQVLTYSPSSLVGGFWVGNGQELYPILYVWFWWSQCRLRMFKNVVSGNGQELYLRMLFLNQNGFFIFSLNRGFQRKIIFSLVPVISDSCWLHEPNSGQEITCAYYCAETFIYITILEGDKPFTELLQITK